ncbi:unnamed protein product [Rotaria sp. Silwood2]|nr:unnamed protein product [Rotaria sp. Silwood2]
MKCSGCSQDFCFDHIAEHRNELSEQLGQCEDQFNEVKIKIEEQKTEPQKNELMKKLDKWEIESIEKIRQMANEIRHELSSCIVEFITDLSLKFQQLTEQIIQCRKANDFSDVEIKFFNEELKRLKDILDNPSDFKIEQDSTTFINKIRLTRKGKSRARFEIVKIKRVIFGDIGTSPLYVLSTIFYYQPSEAQCIGAVSLIVWSLIVAVSIKYGIFILMADNHGECGTFALCGLLTSENSLLSPKTKKMIIVLSLLAGSLLLGDGALTPAVAVLSAVEGVAVEAPKLHNWIVPITVVILVLLFLAQRWGTSKIGVMFGPIMCL